MRRNLSRTTGALLALCALPALAAPPLPRVFYAPQERAAITARRRAGPEPGTSVTIAAPPGQSPDAGGALPQVVKLEGISLARTGGHFAWIGGRRYADGANYGPWQLRISRSGVALVRNGSTVRQVRVGEAIGGTGTKAAP
jgi:hypothetical protein